MSRLIVKNLANSVTLEKLKKVFSEKGIVTDVQLKYTADGKFRHFGFVGFQKEEDALQALEHFNSTFINGSRVKVEQCAALGDPNKPKAWSKHSSDSSAYKKRRQQENQEDSEANTQKKKKKEKQNNSVVDDVLKKYEDDPVFSEFMKVRSKGKQIWSNDHVVEVEQKQKSSKKTNSEGYESDNSSQNDRGNENDSDEDVDEASKVAKTNISDTEYLKIKTKGGKELKEQQIDVAEESKTTKKRKNKRERKNETFYTIKVRGIKFNSKKRDIKEIFKPLKPCSIRFPRNMKGIAYVCFSTEEQMKLALNKDSSIYLGRRISVFQHTVKAVIDNYKWDAQSESLKNEEDVAESGRIFIRNLAYTVTENDLEGLFSKYGPLAEVVMPIDRMSRKPKGFAIITFLMPEHAVKAYLELDGTILHGRMLHLLPGKTQKSIEEMLEMEGLNYKQKRALKIKAQAASSTNWNTLFLGQNAVVDLIAKNYNTTKEKVLDARGKESLAVRLALGETQIVNETRQFLLDSGVHLDAFNQPATQRSKTVILVKNLPAETTNPQICQLFAKFGELGRVLLPPSGITAIVEFLEPSEARAAFRKLAYSKFKDVPLFLEWAPSNTFSSAFSGEKISKSNEVEENKKENKNSKDEEHEGGEEKEEEEQQQTLDEKENSSEDEEEESPEPDTTLFIKNLNFETREDAIKKHFQKCGHVHDVTVARKRDPKNPGNMLSMGYGFIQFKKKASLEKALKSYQQSVLDGHSLELKRSNRTLHLDVATARKTTKIGKQTGAKILVRNVPFQATSREIRELFQTFGEIKFLRLPLKMAGTGSHRGFAFVEYCMKHDAKCAFKALGQSTHLYGRRLALEWASTEEDVDELRRKTANQFKNISAHYQRSKGTADLFDTGEGSFDPM